MPLVTPLRPDDLRRVGRYRLSGRIAEGRDDPDSAGTFLSRLPDGTPVAVTLLGRTAAPDSASRDRFTAEATVARRVAPFCAARILDAGSTAASPSWSVSSSKARPWPRPSRPRDRWTGRYWPRSPSARPPGLPRSTRPGWCTGISGPDHVVLGAEGPRVVHFSTTPPYGPATPSADLLAWAQTILFAAGRPDVASLPEPLRNTVAACLSPDPASRPPARTLVTALLGHNDPAAGLLAEGTRRARAAGRGLVSAGSGRPAEPPTASRSAPGRVGRGLRGLRRGHRGRRHPDRHPPQQPPDHSQAGRGGSHHRLGAYVVRRATPRPRRSRRTWRAPGPARSGRPTRRSR